MNTFKDTVYGFYESNGRSSLPWRPPHCRANPEGTIDPYAVLVSEIMLQQTQVDRVIPKFSAWMERFPTIKDLASASLSDVLHMWQGLGYNRRGLALHACAKHITSSHKGKIPAERSTLKKLPGIGDYTSGALMAFAWNMPEVFIETNIRGVFLYHFFEGHGGVHDSEILPLIEKTLDRSNPREWYYALMDYGSHLKKTHSNPNKKSKHYTKQSSFKGSRREIRSHILSYVLAHGAVPLENILKDISPGTWNIHEIIDDLIKEGFIIKEGSLVRIPTTTQT